MNAKRRIPFQSHALSCNLSAALRAALCIASLFCVNNAIAADSIYKWQDEKGVTHYSQSPPESDADVEKVKTSTKASSDQEQALEQLKQNRQNEMKRLKAASDKSASAEGKTDDKAAEEARAKRCKQNKANLETLRNQPIVRQKDPDTGEMVVLDENQREKMMRDATNALKECD